MSINSIDHEEMSNIAHKWELPEEESVVQPDKTVKSVKPEDALRHFVKSVKVV